MGRPMNLYARWNQSLGHARRHLTKATTILTYYRPVDVPSVVGELESTIGVLQDMREQFSVVAKIALDEFPVKCECP